MLSAILFALSQKESSLWSLFWVLLMACRRPVSLAKWKEEENLTELCKSFMYKRISRGPRTDSCGTPKLTLGQTRFH